MRIVIGSDHAGFALKSKMSDVVRALGHARVAAVVGHDWGAPTAAWCGLIRPDMFQSVVLMSTPFSGSPSLPLGGTARAAARLARGSGTAARRRKAVSRDQRR